MSASGAQLTAEQLLGLNGSHLVDCGDNHRLTDATREAFQAMQRHAMEDGIDLQLVSSFRDFNRQLSIWNRKWQGALPLYDIDDKLLVSTELSDIEKMHAILTWSALPGASRHHWGTDFDVYDRQAVHDWGKPFNLIRSEYQADGPCYKLNCWLQQHAKDYDFAMPYAKYKGGVAPEPWHLSFKPAADQCIEQLSLPLLRANLEQVELEGKDTVLPHLDEIFKRYTLNGGKS